MIMGLEDEEETEYTFNSSFGEFLRTKTELMSVNIAQAQWLWRRLRGTENNSDDTQIPPW